MRRGGVWCDNKNGGGRQSGWALHCLAGNAPRAVASPAARPPLTATPRVAGFGRQVGSGKWSRQSHQEVADGDTAPPADKTQTSGHMMCHLNRPT